MDSQAPTVQIQKTTDYAQFSLMKGNREIDRNHVKRLKKSIKDNPELLPDNPILVNKSLFIIDGQHRHAAVKELGYPLYYVVSETSTLDETRVLNITQKGWTLLDFAHSYAESGKQAYIDFLKLHREYPKLPPSILYLCVVGHKPHDSTGVFRRGELEMRDYAEAERDVKRLDTIRRVGREKINNPMAAALLALFRGDVSGAEEFDYDTFIRKLEMDGARELFTPVGSVRGCLRVIESVYNFHSKTQKRLY